MAEPVRVLRVIARLNMGGPALHVAYLSAGLKDRGYDTTLVAGSLALGEESMAGVAGRLGVPIVTVPDLHREISPLRDLRAVYHVAAPDPRAPAADPAHAHGEGGHDRPARGDPRRRRGPADRRAHLPRPRPAGLLRAAAVDLLPAARALAGQADDRARRGQPRGARRPRRARGRAARRSSPSSGSGSSSRSGSARSTAPLRGWRRGGCSASRRTASSSDGSAG